MNKKYIVRLTDEERAICEATIKKETGKSEKLRRATIPRRPTPTGRLGMTPRSARRSVAGRERSRMCGKPLSSKVLREHWLQETGDRANAEVARRRRRGKLIALRLGKPPAGFGHWTLRLLADEVVELEIVESISPETVRQTLKKTV